MPRSSWGESFFRPVICLLLSVIIGISPTLSLLAATNETSGPSNESSPSGTPLNALKAAALLSQKIESEAKPAPEKKLTPDIKITETKSAVSQMLTLPYTKSLQEISREILKRLLVPGDNNQFQIEVSSSIVPKVALEQTTITRWIKPKGVVERVKKALTAKETYQEVISRFSISLGALAFISNESEFAALMAHRLSKANPNALKNSLGEAFNENIESFFNAIQEYKDLHPTHRDAILADLHATERLIRGGFYPWGVYEVHYKIAQWNKKRSESRIERSLFKLFFGEDYIDIKAQPIPELRLSIIEKYVAYRQSQSDLAAQTSQKSILPKTLKTLRLRATILASPFTNPWIRLAVAGSFGIFWLSQSVDYQSIQNFYDTLSSQFHNIKNPEVADQIYQKGKWILNASAALGGTFILLRYWNSILRTLGKGMAAGLSAGIYLLSAGYNFASELLKTLRDLAIATPNLLWKTAKTIPKPFLFAARLLIGATKSIMSIPSKIAHRFKNRAHEKVPLSGTSSKATSEIEAPLPNTESDIQATSQDEPTKKSWLSRLTQTLLSFETWRSVGRALYKTGDFIGEMTYRILSKTHEVAEKATIFSLKIGAIFAKWLKEILLEFFRWTLNKAFPAIWRFIQDLSLKLLLVAAWFLDLIPNFIEWFDNSKADLYQSAKSVGYSTLKFSLNAATKTLSFSWMATKKIGIGIKHIIFSPYYFIRAFYHGMKSLWKWHADRREKAKADYLAEQDRLSEPERIISSALPETSSLAYREATDLLYRLLGKLHLYSSPGSRRLKKSLKSEGNLYLIPLHQSVPDTYFSFDSKLILAFFKRIADLAPRISSEEKLKIKSYIFDLIYSNPTAILILPEFREAFLNLARSLEMTSSEYLYGEFSLFGYPNMASKLILQDDRDHKWLKRKIELALQDIQVLDDLQNFESFPAWKKVRLLRAITHSRMIKPLDGKIVLGILDTLLKFLPDIVHAAFSKEHPEVKTIPPWKAGQMPPSDHEEILDGKMLIHLMVSSYLREFNSDFLQHRGPHDWNFKNSKTVDFELFKDSGFVKPYIESILSDLMQASKDFYSNIGLAVIFSNRKPLPPKALKWATQQLFSLQKFIEKEFDSVSKLHQWIEDELIPRHIDTELLTPIFYGLIFDHPEWIKNRDDLKALMNTDYFWPKRGSLDVEPSKTEEAIMTGIKEQAKKFPRFWSIEPSAAEALHDRIVRSKETREIYDNQFQSQLDLWLALSAKGVTSTSDQLFESLFERSNEEQKDTLSKEALEGRIWDQPLKAKLIRRMIWKDQNFLDLKAKNSKTRLTPYQRGRLIQKVINSLDQALPERGIAYVHILEDFANEIRATRDETDVIEEAKNIHQNAPSDKAQDYILRSVSEIMDEVLTWKLENQWDFIKFVRGDISASPFIRSIFPAIGPERVRRMFQILPLSVRAGLLETFLASPRGLLADEKSKDKGFHFYSQIMIDHILRDSKSEAKTIASQVLDAFLYALRETGNKRLQPHVFGYLLAMLKENEESSVGATLRHVLEIFGATGIKIGQFLAISQILPEEENHHLLHLQDQALVPERKRIFKELVEISGQDPFPFELQEIIGAASLKYAVMATHRESNEDFVLKVLRNEAINHTNLEFMQLQKMADRLVEANGSRYGIFRAIIRASQKAVQRELQLDQEAVRSQKARQHIYRKNPFENITINVPAELVVAPRLMASQYAPAMSFKELPEDIKPLAARGILKIEVENLFQDPPSDKNNSSAEIVFDPDRHSGNYRVAFERNTDKPLHLTISPIDFGQVLEISFEQRDQVFDLFSLAQILPKTGITRWAAEKILKTIKSNIASSQIDSLVKALTPYFQKVPENTKPISLYYSVLAALEDVNLGLPIVFFDFPRAVIQLAHYTQFVSDLDKTLDPIERLTEIVTLRAEAMKIEMASEISKTDGLAGKVISESIEGNQSRTTKFVLGCRNLIEKLRNGS